MCPGHATKPHGANGAPFCQPSHTDQQMCPYGATGAKTCTVSLSAQLGCARRDPRHSTRHAQNRRPRGKNAPLARMFVQIRALSSNFGVGLLSDPPPDFGPLAGAPRIDLQQRWLRAGPEIIFAAAAPPGRPIGTALPHMLLAFRLRRPLTGRTRSTGSSIGAKRARP